MTNADEAFEDMTDLVASHPSGNAPGPAGGGTFVQDALATLPLLKAIVRHEIARKRFLGLPVNGSTERR